MDSKQIKPYLRTTAAGLLLGYTLACSVSVLAIDAGDATPVSGIGSINKTGNTLNITQNADKAIINWSNYQVLSSETVAYTQPSSNAIVLNRINSGAQSFILGNITANGNVFLINPNGIIFGANASVNVGGLVVSTLGISDADFNNATNSFDFNAESKKGTIINHGTITAASGSVALIGNSVINTNTIRAELGRVTLASATEGTLNFESDGLIRFTISKPVEDSLGNDYAISNTGTNENSGIYAKQIFLDAATAANVFTHVINNEGVLRATTIDNSDGKILLVAEGSAKSSSIRISNSSTINTSNESTSSDGSVVIRAEDGDIEQSGSIQTGRADIVALGDFIQDADGIITANEVISILARGNIQYASLEAPVIDLISINGSITKIEPNDNDNDSNNNNNGNNDNGSDNGDNGDSSGTTDENENLDANTIVNANAIASAAEADNIANIASTSLGLYSVEGSGIKLPADQETEL